MWLDVKIVMKTEGWPISFSKPPRSYLYFSENITFLSLESVFIEALTEDGLQQLFPFSSLPFSTQHDLSERWFDISIPSRTLGGSRHSIAGFGPSRSLEAGNQDPRPPSASAPCPSHITAQALVPPPRSVIEATPDVPTSFDLLYLGRSPPGVG